MCNWINFAYFLLGNYVKIKSIVCLYCRENGKIYFHCLRAINNFVRTIKLIFSSGNNDVVFTIKQI